MVVDSRLRSRHSEPACKSHRRMILEAVLSVDNGGLREGLLNLFDGLKGVEVLTLANVFLRLASPDAEEAELLVHRSVGRRLRSSSGGKVVDVPVRSEILIWYGGERSA